jgi:hypothetical protein
MTHDSLEQEDFQTVLRVTAMIENTQENIHDWLELDEGTSASTGGRNCCSDIFLFIFIRTTSYIFHLFVF